MREMANDSLATTPQVLIIGGRLPGIRNLHENTTVLSHNQTPETALDGCYRYQVGLVVTTIKHIRPTED